MPFLPSQPTTADMLESKYREPFTAWKNNPTTTATGALLKAIQPEVDRGIFAHVGTNPSPTLRSRAKRLAISAIRSYDPTQAKLGTHIVNQLQGLKRITRQQTQILSIPERVALDQGFIEKAKAELEDELGREPNTAELADRTNLSPKRIAYVAKFRYPKSEGSFDSMAAGEDSGFSPAVNQQQSDSWLNFVYSDLDDVSKKIMEWTLGLNGTKKLSNQAIATRLRITPGAVSQRKARIQQLLDQQELNPFSTE